MSVITVDRASPAPRLRPRTVAWQLASAECVKVDKRRGLVALASPLTVGAVVIAGERRLYRVVAGRGRGRAGGRHDGGR